jgi:hypothetical protein
MGSKECHGTRSAQTKGDGHALIPARVAQQDSAATDSRISGHGATDAVV